jgi:4a-hydroxytetrahydrobiopterin dehydratase
MKNISKQHCEPCRNMAPKATAEEITTYREQIPNWEIVTIAGIERLRRVFKFRNFAEALDFTNRVGVLAEQEDHHPALLTEWGRVTVQWWTHAIGGLHRNDFIMAAKTDELCE